MTEPYNHTIADHYAAYRPPLHQLILRRLLSNSDQFEDGVDIGCGTGRSSTSPAEFCQQIYAIDPSQSMLDAATPHDVIVYSYRFL